MARLKPGASLRKLLDEALCSTDPGSELERLYVSGDLDDMPEIGAIVALGDMGGLHKDVWSHTKAVVAGVPNALELRWSALLHDIGKARTRRVGKGGRVTFHGHDVVGARMVDSLQDRLGLFDDDDSLFVTVRSLVLHHLRPASYRASWSDSAVRRLLTELGSLRNFEQLLCLSRADLTTKVPARRQRALARSAQLAERVQQVYEEANRFKLPKGTMGLVLERSKLKPGPWLNDVRAELERLVETKQLPSTGDAEYYAGCAAIIIKGKADV